MPRFRPRLRFSLQSLLLAITLLAFSFGAIRGLLHFREFINVNSVLRNPSIEPEVILGRPPAQPPLLDSR